MNEDNFLRQAHPLYDAFCREDERAQEEVEQEREQELADSICKLSRDLED